MFLNYSSSKEAAFVSFSRREDRGEIESNHLPRRRFFDSRETKEKI